MTLFKLLKERVGDHPNIVRLLEVNFEEPPFYIVMDHVEGQDLRTWSAERGGVGSVPLELRLEIVAQVADALQAAHDAGVIHRDVKPGNILIADRGLRLADCENPKSEIRSSKLGVKLTDFGIGQVISEEHLSGVTRAGFTQTMLSGSSSSQAGTQMYMAPELLAGKPASIRSDIYSLGVVLYQLVIGDFTRPVTTDWARDIEDSLLREDLARCFAGNPQERFDGAGQLAKNLRSLQARRAEFVRQQAALALRERASYRRGVIRTAAAAALVVAAMAVLAVFAFQQARRADQNAARVEAAARILRLSLYVTEIKIAHLAFQEFNVGHARALLNRHRPEIGIPHLTSWEMAKGSQHADLRGFEWRYLWGQTEGKETFSLRPHSNRANCVAFSPDGTLLATSGDDGMVRIWETASRTQRIALTGFTNFPTLLRTALHSLSFSPDGKLLALADRSSVVVWETARWSVQIRLPREASVSSVVVPVVFSPDGKTLAARSAQRILFWDTSHWTLRNAMASQIQDAQAFCYSDDGAFLAIGVGQLSPRTELWDGSGQIKLGQFPKFHVALKFAPGSSLMAAADAEGNIALWDAATRQQVANWNAHPSSVSGLSFSIDGKILATCGSDQAIHIWDLASNRRLSTFTGHQARLRAVSFSPKEPMLVSASEDGTVKFWNTNVEAEGDDWKQTVTPLWFSADRDLLRLRKTVPE